MPARKARWQKLAQVCSLGPRTRYVNAAQAALDGVTVELAGLSALLPSSPRTRADRQAAGSAEAATAEGARLTKLLGIAHARERELRRVLEATQRKLAEAVAAARAAGAAVRVPASVALMPPDTDELPPCKRARRSPPAAGALCPATPLSSAPASAPAHPSPPAAVPFTEAAGLEPLAPPASAVVRRPRPLARCAAVPERKLQALDLFSGIGGWAVGLRCISTVRAYCDNCVQKAAFLEEAMAAGTIDQAPVWCHSVESLLVEAARARCTPSCCS